MSDIRITERGKRTLELLKSGLSLDEVEKIVDEELPMSEKPKMSREEFGKLFDKGGAIE